MTTADTPPTPADDQGQEEGPRPGSRAARLAQPLALDVVKQLAEDHGVCTKPLLLRMTDLATGRTEVVDLPCRSTRASKCRPCANRAKKLRAVQCREGWHRDEEWPEPNEPDELQHALISWRAELELRLHQAEARADWTTVEAEQAAIDEVEKLITATGLRGSITRKPKEGEDQGVRRVRSTRRRQDTPDLPRRKVSKRTIGRTFVGNDGTVFRPSTFLTLTLPSYGRVREDGSPVDMDTYDYRRAAWDAVHFPALLDRFWQNLRRVEGWNIQYFGAIEPQRRLAPHAHFAVRGTFPRAVLRQVVAATYYQVWWPPTDTVVYGEGDAQPVWTVNADGKGGYTDPATGQALPTWQEALDLLDIALEQQPDRAPEHVVRFGAQVDVQGVLAGTDQAEKLIGYLTKYLTKSVAECHQLTTPGQVEHHRRLYEELRFTPCSPRCANWLRYGIQPKNARRRQVAGRCKGKVHHPETLGIGGRRVLVSRQWSGKTLADHRYDQGAWVRKVLAVGIGHREPGHETVDDQVQAARAGKAAAPVRWERTTPKDGGISELPRRLLRAIATRVRQRAQIREALAAAGPPQADVSAIRVERGEAA